MSHTSLAPAPCPTRHRKGGTRACGEEGVRRESTVKERSRETQRAVPSPAGEPRAERTQTDRTASLSQTTWTVEAVFREHAARVYSLARRMLGNDVDAEDATQEVLLQVVRKLDTFRGEAALTTWLYRITANVALALRRKRASRRERQMKDSLDVLLDDRDGVTPVRGGRTAPDEQALGQELRLLLEEAIAALPDLYRDVLVLADVEGRANAEVGAILGLSLTATKSRLHRARLMLRRVLAPHFAEGTR
jgi:RNA polymerase sigma-70 factor, ECF subfamily